MTTAAPSLEELGERLCAAPDASAPIVLLIRDALCAQNHSTAGSHTPGVVVHGGAGAISRARMTLEDAKAYIHALEDATLAGMLALARGGSSIDAAVLAVQCLEWCPLFNAGVGSVYRSDGSHRMDASVMDGETGDFGAIAGSSRILYPVVAAQMALRQGAARGGLLVQGSLADTFAEACGAEVVENTHFGTDSRRRQWEEARGSGSVQLDHDGDGTRGTVGAVVRDSRGRLAAATSTGGLVNVHPGRVGDSAVVGAGTWADQRVAVSGTGQGEQFIRHQTARRVASLMELAALPLEEAATRAVAEMPPTAGGLIAIDNHGHAAWPRSTEGMYRARTDGREITVGIHDEETTQTLEELLSDRGWHRLP